MEKKKLKQEKREHKDKVEKIRIILSCALRTLESLKKKERCHSHTHTHTHAQSEIYIIEKRQKGILIFSL